MPEDKKKSSAHIIHTNIINPRVLFITLLYNALEMLKRRHAVSSKRHDKTNTRDRGRKPNSVLPIAVQRFQYADGTPFVLSPSSLPSQFYHESAMHAMHRACGAVIVLLTEVLIDEFGHLKH